MARMFASDRGCIGATVERSGRRYDADRDGFIHVEDGKDATRLREAGYVEAGGIGAYVSKSYRCECGWEAIIRHCPRCDRDDLVRVDG